MDESEPANPNIKQHYGCMGVALKHYHHHLTLLISMSSLQTVTNLGAFLGSRENADSTSIGKPVLFLDQIRA